LAIFNDERYKGRWYRNEIKGGSQLYVRGTNIKEKKDTRIMHIWSHSFLYDSREELIPSCVGYIN